jgi:uncharacterized protein (TIGR00369 family)
MPDLREPATVPFVPTAAEALFAVTSLAGSAELTTGTMRTGPWSTAADGRPAPGSLGVLLDDVVGYAVVAARPPGHWAVSVELHVDFCGELPGPGQELRGESRVVRADGVGGLAEGRVLDSAGRVVASCSERMLFVPGEPTGLGTPVGPAAWVPGRRPVTDVGTMLGVDQRRTDMGATLALTAGEELTNPVGNLHGGVLLCLTELAGGHALRDPAAPLISSSVHITFVRPVALHQQVRLDASVVHRGRKLGVASVVTTDAAGTLCTVATVTGRAPS